MYNYLHINITENKIDTVVLNLGSHQFKSSPRHGDTCNITVCGSARKITRPCRRSGNKNEAGACNQGQNSVLLGPPELVCQPSCAKTVTHGRMNASLTQTMFGYRTNIRSSSPSRLTYTTGDPIIGCHMNQKVLCSSNRYLWRPFKNANKWEFGNIMCRT